MRPFAALAALISAGFLLSPGLARAQKVPLGHDVYDSWRRLASPQLSADGDWAMVSINPAVGDGELVLRHRDGRELKFPGTASAQFSRNGRFVVALFQPPRAEVDKARRERKPERDRPKPSLGIVDLSTGQMTRIERVRSYRLPDRDSGWFAYQLDDAPTPAPAAAPATPAPAAPAAQAPAQAAAPARTAKKRDHEPGREWVVRHLPSGQEVKLAFVSSLEFSRKGRVLAVAFSDRTGEGDGVSVWDLPNGKRHDLLKGLGRYQQLAVHDSGTVAFVTDRDDYKSDLPEFTLQLWRLSAPTEAPKTVAKSGTRGIPDGWVVVNRGNLRFSESGSRLLFATAPKPEPEPRDDTPEEDRVNVDVWSWTDPLMMPQQLLQAATERNRSYLASLDVRSGRIAQLARLDIPNVEVGKQGDADVAVGTSNLPYRQLISWDRSYVDVYTIDVDSGEARLVLKKVGGIPSTSPGGTYASWWDGDLRQWRALELRSRRVFDLSAAIKEPLVEANFDRPGDPGPAGPATWVADDQFILIKDLYDLWRVDPRNPENPVNLTDGVGKARDLDFRVVDLDTESPGLEPGVLLLRAVNRETYWEGFFRDHLTDRVAPERLIYDRKSFALAAKARTSQDVLITRQDFVEFPNLWRTNLSFSGLDQITDANPQQSKYLWGTAEQVRWTSSNGTPMKGVLIKPENYDITKKYPMIVYFYEESSQDLFRHRVPAPSASVINPTMYASNGYVVFMPDILYRTGYPGESSEHAILPGVTDLINRGIADPKRIGIQGQSWGGYQVAHLVTRTQIFAAACAGAPVSNMFSAYNGIRYGSGVVRQMQYEVGQSRIGATMWEAPLQYIENSPIFWADKIRTPLLIMSNDRDGAVPWTEGIQLFAGLRRLQRPTWLFNYNGDDHNLTRRPNQKDWSVRMQQFFDHYLKGAPAPVWMREGVPAVRKGRTLGLEVPEKQER